jgi:hypothetical protein
MHCWISARYLIKYLNHNHCNWLVWKENEYLSLYKVSYIEKKGLMSNKLSYCHLVNYIRSLLG